MKAMGFSKTVVTGVALNSDSTSGDYGKLTVTKNTGQNGADQSSTIDLPSIYAKKNDEYLTLRNLSYTYSESVVGNNWDCKLRFHDKNSSPVSNIASGIGENFNATEFGTAGKNAEYNNVRLVGLGSSDTPRGSIVWYFQPAPRSVSDTSSANYRAPIGLGHPSTPWVDFYMSGVINKNSNGYGLALPSTSGISSNKTLVPKEDLLELMYPIGSIYISYTQNDDTANTTGKYGCPIADTLGGIWERIEGRFLVSIGSNGSSGADALTITVDPNEPSSYTGGAATHTLQKAELPSYTIDSTNKVLTGAFEIRDYGASGSFDATLTPKAGASGGTIITKTDNNGANVATTFSPQSQNTYKRTSIYVDARHTHSSGGSGQEFSIIPPYLAVYMWKRTA